MTPLRRGVHRLRRRLGDEAGDGGFTLLEVVVSFVLFAIVASGATVAIVSALNASHGSQQRIDAANIAQADISSDIARANAGTAPTATSGQTVGVQNEQFTLTRTVTPSVSSCGAGTPTLVKVHVVVAQAQTGKFLAQSDTVIAC